MKPNVSYVLKGVAVVVFFVCFKLLVQVFVLSSFAKVEIDAVFDHADTVKVFYSISSQFQESLSSATQEFQQGKRGTLQAEIKNHIARRVRIDVGNHPGRMELFGISFRSFFGEPITFSPAQIYTQFVPNKDITNYRLEGDHLVIESQGGDPYLLLKGTLCLHNLFIGWLVPALFSFVFYLFLERFSFATFPAFADIGSKSSSTGANISALDGIRGFAALTILAEHAGFLKGIGYLGILFFFALSGYLLSAPFIQQPNRAISYTYMTNYIVRRLKRIMPMHYVVITLFFLLRGKIAEAFRNYIYVQSDGILWTVVQELFFYLVLPVLMAAIYLFFKGRKGFAVIFCFCILLLSNAYLTTAIISLYGNSIKNSPKIGIFLSGVMFAYLSAWLISHPVFQKLNQKMIRTVSSTAGVVLFSLLVIFSLKLVPGLRYYNPLDRSDIFGLLSGLFILLVVLSHKSFLGKDSRMVPAQGRGGRQL